MTRMITAAALAATAIVGGTWFLGQPVGTGAPLPGAASAQDAAEIDTSTVPEMTLGADDAPVEVIEYASFTCPHCASFHDEQFPQLKEDYIETGLVRFVYREVYFDRFGLWASMVARCGGEEKFFGISDMLYDQQRDWIAGGQRSAVIAGNLRRIGLTAGDRARSAGCLPVGRDTGPNAGRVVRRERRRGRGDRHAHIGHRRDEIQQHGLRRSFRADR